MALNPDQFNEILKGAGRREKMTVAGERFLHHDELSSRGLSPYPEHSDASLGAGFVTVDGYGLERTPSSGLRSVYAPNGENLEDVTSHKEGVRVIKEHREGKY